jgi:recombination protein RecR
MNPISKLTELFSELPGIGPRQAKRFVYYLLTRNQNFLDDLIKNISELKGHIAVCAQCQRFFEKTNGAGLCSICRDKNRDQNTLMIVSRDTDLENIEKTRTYNGIYFVLGGSIPLLEKTPGDRIRSEKLGGLVEKKKDEGTLEEIILALNATPEGEHTGDIIEKMLRPTLESVKISRLGKGISTGTELEYSDGETIKNALKNRA